MHTQHGQPQPETFYTATDFGSGGARPKTSRTNTTTTGDGAGSGVVQVSQRAWNTLIETFPDASATDLEALFDPKTGRLKMLKWLASVKKHMTCSP